MAELIYNCPRCGTQKTTFNLEAYHWIEEVDFWQNIFEAYCVCRSCNKGTIFIVIENAHDSNFTKAVHEGANINQEVDILRYVNTRENSTDKPPEYLPNDINSIFEEAITCKSVECFNASASMFRLCLDKATQELLPKENENGLNNSIRRSLGHRIEWLLKNSYLPKALEGLAQCIKDDGNDGAHEGTLGKEELEDLYDFTYILLERLYTEPKKLQLAKERREARHKKE